MLAVLGAAEAPSRPGKLRVSGPQPAAAVQARLHLLARVASTQSTRATRRLRALPARHQVRVLAGILCHRSTKQSHGRNVRTRPRPLSRLLQTSVSL